jgi:hypothetical protein
VGEARGLLPYTLEWQRGYQHLQRGGPASGNPAPCTCLVLVLCGGMVPGLSAIAFASYTCELGICYLSYPLKPSTLLLYCTLGPGWGGDSTSSS